MITAEWLRTFDAAAWQDIATSGRLSECPPGTVVAALRALIGTDRHRLCDTLAVHVSTVMLRRVRRAVGTHHPNRGEDAVERAHAALLQAVFDPSSADGADLETNFEARVHFRALDAIRTERRHRQRFVPYVLDNDGEPRIPAGNRLDSGGVATVEHLITRIGDPRKRLAFRLFMDGMRVRAGDPSVASVLGVDPKTAAKWIEEAKLILAANMIGA